MYTFCSAILCLIVGYLLYGAFVERVFGVDSQRKTPCFTKNDGVDFMPLPTWKVFLIQFLNIAGTGPIFGAVMGILLVLQPTCGLCLDVFLPVPRTTISVE